MTVRLSDKAAAAIANDGSIKEAFHDFCIELYAGSQPASANNAPNAVKLMTITKDGVAWTTSVAQKNTFTITDATVGNTQIATLNGTAYTYTNGAGETTTTVAAAVAALLDATKVVHAVSDGAVVVVYARYAGVSFTLTAGGTGNPSTAAVTANSRGTGLQFATSTTGVLVMESATWQGTGLADGIIGWARIKGDITDDDSTSTSFKRMDLSINTANSDMIALVTLNVTTGGVNNVTAFTFTQPQA